MESLYFTGIVSDLFPRMLEEPVDYGILEASIKSSCINLGLEDVDGEFFNCCNNNRNNASKLEERFIINFCFLLFIIT